MKLGLAVTAAAMIAGAAITACASAAPLAAVSGEARREAGALTPANLSRIDEQFAALMKRTSPASGESIYVAQQLGTPLVNAIFTLGNAPSQARALHEMANFVGALPTLDSVASGSLNQAIARSITDQSGVLRWAREHLVALDQSFDGLPLPNGGAGRRHVFPMTTGGALRIETGNAQQFAYLASTMLRLASQSSPPGGQARQWNRDLKTLYAFLADDTLRFYWLEATAWHWRGAFPNMRTRTLARLDGAPGMETRIFFRAFTDYDLHILAIGADLKAATRFAPSLVRSRADTDLIDDVSRIGWRVLLTRIDLDLDGRGFAFDRGMWRDNPASAYADCEEPLPPREKCPRARIAQDVSHAQRWPLWLQSFLQAFPDPDHAHRIDAWRRGLASEIGQKVIRYDSAERPLMANFVDGHDGWYLYVKTPTEESGHAPSSLTGWSMRHGNWALLGRLDTHLAEGYRRFCRVIASSSSDDIEFRTTHYGAPGTDASTGFASTRDEFGPTSFYVTPCRIYHAMGLI